MESNTVASPPKIYVHLELQNLTLFGTTAFVDVTS